MPSARRLFHMLKQARLALFCMQPGIELVDHFCPIGIFQNFFL
jgi:hypothetical protein